MSLRRHRLSSTEGASAVEYALLIAGLAAIIAVTVFAVGRGMASQLTRTGSCLSSSVCAQSPASNPTPSPTRTNGSGNRGSGNNGNNGNGDDRDD